MMLRICFVVSQNEVRGRGVGSVGWVGGWGWGWGHSTQNGLLLIVLFNIIISSEFSAGLPRTVPVDLVASALTDARRNRLII